jgi:ATP-dependent protease HslVU (ClpYQ) peptidase subunit
MERMLCVLLNQTTLAIQTSTKTILASENGLFITAPRTYAFSAASIVTNKFIKVLRAELQPFMK